MQSSDGADAVAPVEIGDRHPDAAAAGDDVSASGGSAGTVSVNHWVTGIAAGSPVPRSCEPVPRRSAPGAPVSRSAPSPAPQSAARRRPSPPARRSDRRERSVRAGALPLAPGVDGQEREDGDRGGHVDGSAVTRPGPTRPGDADRVQHPGERR